MSELHAEVIPGKTLGPNEKLTNAILNLMATPIVNITGVVGSAAIGPGAVDTANLAEGAVTKTKLDPDCAGLGLSYDPATGLSLNGDGQMLVAGGMTNLKIAPEVGTDTTAVHIKADELLLKSPAGGSYMAQTVDVLLPIDVDFDGVNGGLADVEGNARAINTWYYIFVFYSPTLGRVVPVLLDTALEMGLPDGFTHQALIGAIRTNAVGAGEIEDFCQRNRQVLTKWAAVVAAGISANWIELDLAATVPVAVPPNASRVQGYFRAVSTIGTWPPVMAVAARATVGVPFGAPYDDAASLGVIITPAGSFDLPLINGQKMYWSGSTLNAHNLVVITGWSF